MCKYTKISESLFRILFEQFQFGQFEKHIYISQHESKPETKTVSPIPMCIHALNAKPRSVYQMKFREGFENIYLSSTPVPTGDF